MGTAFRALVRRRGHVPLTHVSSPVQRTWFEPAARRPLIGRLFAAVWSDEARDGTVIARSDAVSRARGRGASLVAPISVGMSRINALVTNAELVHHGMRTAICCRRGSSDDTAR
jgi:hypothetical protein